MKLLGRKSVVTVCRSSHIFACLLTFNGKLNSELTREKVIVNIFVYYCRMKCTEVMVKSNNLNTFYVTCIKLIMK